MADKPVPGSIEWQRQVIKDEYVLGVLHERDKRNDRRGRFDGERRLSSKRGCIRKNRYTG